MAIQVFGGGAVQTAYVSYDYLDLTTGSIILVWPTSYVNVPYTQDGINYNVLAASMEVNTGADNIRTITLPDATMSSVGSNFIITNVGLSSFQLLKSNGDELITIPTTENANSYWVQLTDNSTAEGTWQFVQFGAGTSAADASVLAGKGLVALSGTLNSNIPVVSLTNESIIMSNYAVQVTDRATLFIWKAGTGTFTLPAIGAVPAGFFVSLNVEAESFVTLQATGSVPIDDQETIVIQQFQSLSVISDGTNWWTLGFGQNLLSNSFANGTAANPSITFFNDDTTGIYYNGDPYLGFSVSGHQVAKMSQVEDTSSTLTIIYADKNFALTANETTGVISYGDENNITLKSDGSVTAGIFSSSYLDIEQDSGIVTLKSTGSMGFSAATFIQFNGSTLQNISQLTTINLTATGTVTLTNPLPISSGGTGATTQQTAINALMPTTGTSLLAYFNGMNWVPTAGTITEGYILKLVGGVPTWSAP